MSTTPTIPTPQSRVRVIFQGPHGQRAGWRVLIFLLLVAGFSALAAPVVRLLSQEFYDALTARTLILSESIGFIVVILATAIMARLGHGSLATYGLPVRQMFRKNFWAGALWGFLMLTVIMGMMRISHVYSLAGLALSGASLLKYAFLWAVAFLLVGLFEESLFRGYVQFTLTSGLGFWPAAAITCTAFALAHRGNPGETWVGLANIVLIAIFLSLALRRTGNLWFAIGWHMAFDWGESFFYSVPNSGTHTIGHLLNASLGGSQWLSGGTVGPEGSVFDLLVMAAGIALLARIYPEAKYPAVPPGPAPPSDAETTANLPGIQSS
ncbi:MAG: type II CAAX endopeptidase family protein [Acidobacteriota bacterium]|nr:type II CAAX endopeptidase family protein [Acidobacteriota bacterium]